VMMASVITPVPINPNLIAALVALRHLRASHVWCAVSTLGEAVDLLSAYTNEHYRFRCFSGHNSVVCNIATLGHLGADDTDKDISLRLIRF
jgi:hypothetical protein